MSSIIHSQAADIPANMTTTAFDVAGFRIVDNLGVVRGVVVRSRSVFGTIGAGLFQRRRSVFPSFSVVFENSHQSSIDQQYSTCQFFLVLVVIQCLLDFSQSIVTQTVETLHVNTTEKNSEHSDE